MRFHIVNKFSLNVWILQSIDEVGSYMWGRDINEYMILFTDHEGRERVLDLVGAPLEVNQFIEWLDEKVLAIKGMRRVPFFNPSGKLYGSAVG